MFSYFTQGKNRRRDAEAKTAPKLWKGKTMDELNKYKNEQVFFSHLDACEYPISYYIKTRSMPIVLFSCFIVIDYAKKYESRSQFAMFHLPPCSSLSYIVQPRVAQSAKMSQLSFPAKVPASCSINSG